MADHDRRRTLLLYLAAAVVFGLLAMRMLGSGGTSTGPSVAVDGPGATHPPATRPRAGRIWVHVAGAVRKPGLYRVAQNARAGTAVDAAGGISRKADLRAINLAA